MRRAWDRLASVRSQRGGRETGMKLLQRRKGVQFETRKLRTGAVRAVYLPTLRYAKDGAPGGYRWIEKEERAGWIDSVAGAGVQVLWRFGDEEEQRQHEGAEDGEHLDDVEVGEHSGLPVQEVVDVGLRGVRASAG